LALTEILTPLSARGGHLDKSNDLLRAMVRAVRTHLGMDVGFISEFGDQFRTFRVVDANGNTPIEQGSSMPMDQGFCARVAAGHLPQLIPDTALVPAAESLSTGMDMPVGAHLSVPIQLKDGQVYGTFCCLSHTAEPRLSERDLCTMRAFAEVMAFHIDAEHETSGADPRRERVARALQLGDPSIVFQPIVRLADNTVVGHEALARFSSLPVRTPDLWFADAAIVGLGAELEMAAIRRAVSDYSSAAASSLLHLNCSPQTLVQHGVPLELFEFGLDRVVLELTEHHAVGDYDEVLQALAPLRAGGMLIAVDDAGAGYSSMRHVLMLQPDLIKLDISLVRDIDTDGVKRALAEAVCTFARQTGCTIIAEGVETAREAKTLVELGADEAQGYFFGRPDVLAQRSSAE